jgi:hypothetical protein
MIVTTWPMTAIRASISCSATGLTYDVSTGILSLATGYAIPTTTEINAWNALVSDTGLWGTYASISGPTQARTYTFPDADATVLYDGKTSGVLATVYGSTAANGHLLLEGTSSATRTSAYTALQTSGGGVGVGGTPAAFQRFTVTGSLTASSGLCIGQYIATTLVAAANNDLLTALYVNPTFTLGSYTGTKSYAIYSPVAAAAWYAAGNVGIGVLVDGYGTSATKVLGIGSGTAPSTAPANMAQMWTEDINGAAGYAGLHKRTETTNLTEIIPGVPARYLIPMRD